MNITIDFNTHNIMGDGEKLGCIYEPMQDPFTIPSHNVTVVVGMEDVLVFDSTTGEQLLAEHQQSCWNN